MPFELSDSASGATDLGKKNLQRLREDLATYAGQISGESDPTLTALDLTTLGKGGSGSIGAAGKAISSLQEVYSAMKVAFDSTTGLIRGGIDEVRRILTQPYASVPSGSILGGGGLGSMEELDLGIQRGLTLTLTLTLIGGA